MSKPTVKSELWQRIRAARRYGQVTADKLAKACGVSRPAVSLWEAISPHNRTQPHADQLMVIAEVCGVSAQFLLDDSAHPDEVYTYGKKADIRQPPAAPTPGDMTDRQAKAFWSAVKFGVLSVKPELMDAFDVEVQVGDETLTVPFMHGDAIALFGSSTTGALTKELGQLLVFERAAGHPYKKHLFRWSPDNTPAPRLNTSFDMTIKSFTEINDAVKALLSIHTL